MTNLMTERNGDARPDVDTMLRDYYQAELPNPWPRFAMPRQKQPATFWSRNGGRMALAASIAVLIAGYLTLTGFFPHAPSPSGVTPINMIGKKEPAKGNPHVLDPMPNK